MINDDIRAVLSIWELILMINDDFRVCFPDMGVNSDD